MFCNTLRAEKVGMRQQNDPFGLNFPSTWPLAVSQAMLLGLCEVAKFKIVLDCILVCFFVSENKSI